MVPDLLSDPKPGIPPGPSRISSYPNVWQAGDKITGHVRIFHRMMNSVFGDKAYGTISENARMQAIPFNPVV
jgi:hypothetical protein